ncbi:hypothetical protein TPHA_0D00910 [Tetrapisispora phaffii CBS 4417]|uniref:Uncharacterized protein n=1 Tax=Tetrapisispora phaffii (strain ATCC 24235 / CBS 4417 / NBRC 1672 / NRRL Y-8282 / UCD 70-5) TaxID=1071381 RepID=G8BSB1_TETPH|nr:hypothetical protein TPHA_0D00910 [Tetrapisispora phaffii CBS 4417]CCE62732.1 hypothetical protein TPHA_0D00910 [Tetrapisispora phaffii CBS 4417]
MSMSSERSDVPKSDRKSILSFFQNPSIDRKKSEKQMSSEEVRANVINDDKGKSMSNDVEITTISDSESEQEQENPSESTGVHKKVNLVTGSNEVDIIKHIDLQKKAEIETDVGNGNQVKKEEKSKNNEANDSSKEEKAKQKREALQKERDAKLKLKEEDKKQKELQRKKEKLEREKRLQEEKKKREEKAEEVKRKREEVRLLKEAEKLKREEERLAVKRKREEEKKAKERAQSRIGNFFKKVNDSGTMISSKTDYEKQFLKFYATEGVHLSTSPQLSSDDLKESIKKLDLFLNSRLEDNTEDINQWLDKRTKRRGYKVKNTAVNLLQQMTTKEKGDDALQAMLSLVPTKYIKFYENVRPPYMGTYSKDIIIPANNPFTTEGTGYSYDYDSDLEWVNEEDEEGGEIDDLESGEEDEEEEDDEASEGEFDEFLDSEDKHETKKKKFIGPLIPIVHLRNDIDKLEEDDKTYFEQLSIEFLLDPTAYPIDPLATPSIIANMNNNQYSNTSEAIDNNTSPLKRPSTALEDGDITGTSTPGSSPDKKKQKHLITETKALLKLFDNLQDSTFSLATVTEIVQKHIPNYNKQIIKNTVKEYAVRSTGKGDTPRKWSIKDMSAWNELRSKLDKKE